MNYGKYPLDGASYQGPCICRHGHSTVLPHSASQKIILQPNFNDKHFAVFKHITTHIQCWSCRNIYSIFLCWKWDTDSSYLTDLPSLPKISSTRTSFLFLLLSSVEPNAATRQCDVSFPKCSFTTSKVQDEWKFRGPSITFSYNI